MKIINTGGTFNKRYDPIKGELYVPRDNSAVEAILRTFTETLEVEGVIYKDSLEMDDNDRDHLCRNIEQSGDKAIVIVHGTDTMDVSAAAIDAHRFEKTIVLTGAMVPFSIDPVEATANIALAIGFAKAAKPGVYIAMQGNVAPYQQMIKNRKLGKFECQK